MKTDGTVASISASAWNKQIDIISMRLPMTVTETESSWQHPWSIETRWKPFKADNMDEGEWLARIVPGFVNGLDPEIDTLAKHCGERTIARLTEENGGEKPKDDASAIARIAELPFFPISNMRQIGYGADPTSVEISMNGTTTQTFEAVPQFFKALGVVNNLDDLPKGDKPRTLMACDVVLTVDRLRAIAEVMQGDGFMETFTALISVKYGRTSPPRERPKITVQSKFTPYISQQLTGANQEATDPEIDELKIATIYLLSQQEETPKWKWQPYIEQAVFWNLNHAPAKIPDAANFLPLTLTTCLAAGIANSLFATMLVNINDQMSEAIAMSRVNDMSGRFWTL